MARKAGDIFDCAGCGAGIQMVLGPKGKLIPLETRLRHHVFEVSADGLSCKWVGRGFLNHFVTCPKRDQFKGRTRDG